MELTAQEDIDAPIEKVFAKVSDFDGIVKQAQGRGVKVERTDDLKQKAEGMAWSIRFQFRGKPRDVDLSLAEHTPPEKLRFHGVSGGLEAETEMDFTALSPDKTRIRLATVMVPKTLSARLLVQSLKLGRTGLEKRFRKRMARLARELEKKLTGAA